MRILIVEDEPGLQLGLNDLFEEAGYLPTVCSSGRAALMELEEGSFAMILLDLGLPDIDGTRVLEYCNTHLPEVPVMVLTARASEADVVLGFKLGAFDYVTKPYSPRILLARVNALVRRVRPEQNAITLGDIEVDFDRYEARQAGELLHLTTREIDLLKFLFEHEGKPVSRNDILDEVWGMSSEAGTRTVDTHIAMLRKKVEPNPEKPTYILSQRGIGYKMVLR